MWLSSRTPTQRHPMREIADTPKVSAFLEERGLDPEFATRCGVRAFDHDRIAWPLWNGQWKLRHVDTKDMMVAKMGIDEKPMPAVFGDLFCWRTQSTPFHFHLCEGETDALAMAQVLFDNQLPGAAIAVPGVNGLHHCLRLLSPVQAQGNEGDNRTHISMYPDPDTAGETLAGAASSLGAHVIRLPVGQDLCAFLGALHRGVRWSALQLLRHHAAAYVPFATPERPRESTRAHKGTDVPPGVVSYFERLVAETCPDQYLGYSNVEKICCPWHEDPNPSLSIDWDRCIWFCHGCGTGGGVKKWQQLHHELGMTG